jgi:hypothetical protein
VCARRYKLNGRNLVMFSTDSPDIEVAKRLLDVAKSQGFVFQRIAPGPDGPLHGVRETTAYVETCYLGGFGEGCSATRARKYSLIVPSGLPITERINGDALTVLHVLVSDWAPT